MADVIQAEQPPVGEPQANGIPDGLYEDDKNKMRPADIDADMREMERRKRVEMIMNSRLFREELERIIEVQMKDGSGPAGLLQQISDMMGVQGGRLNSGNMFRSSNCVVPINDIRGVESMGYAKGEKILRCKLAAVYRLMDLYGWTQGIYNHITARLNQDQEHFLVNPFGMLYHEITASSLVKIDMQGGIVESGTTNFNVNVGGFMLHSAIHAARPDVKCIIHVHTPSVLAVSSLKCGLLPLCQEAIVIGEVSQHPYLGALYEPEEREKIARNLGPMNKVMFLANHGVVCCGETVEEAFFNIYNTVLACETQIKLMPMGVDNLVLVSDETRKQVYEAARRAPDSTPKQEAVDLPPTGIKKEKQWRIGSVEFEALMRMLDNAGFRTGYIYRYPLVKGDPPRPRNDVEVPPAVSSLGYLLEEEEMYKQGQWRKYMDGRKTHDRTRWLNSPNVYQKVEILETGTPDPKKITKWVADGSPTHSSTPVKIESALQFVPKNTDPREFKKLQQQIKDNRRADKITSGPQSHILEGVSWEEAKKLQDANITVTGDQVILVGAASKGIIQRGFQHNAMVYKTPYAKNPFDTITDEELEEYKKVVERKQRGESFDEDQSESEPLSSSLHNSRPTHGEILGNLKSPLLSPTSAASETEEESRDEPRVLRIETKQVPRPSQAEVVLSDAESDLPDPIVERSMSLRYPVKVPDATEASTHFKRSWSLGRDKHRSKDGCGKVLDQYINRKIDLQQAEDFRQVQTPPQCYIVHYTKTAPKMRPIFTYITKCATWKPAVPVPPPNPWSFIPNHVTEHSTNDKLKHSIICSYTNKHTRNDSIILSNFVNTAQIHLAHKVVKPLLTHLLVGIKCTSKDSMLTLPYNMKSDTHNSVDDLMQEVTCIADVTTPTTLSKLRNSVLIYCHGIMKNPQTTNLNIIGIDKQYLQLFSRILDSTMAHINLGYTFQKVESDFGCTIYCNTGHIQSKIYLTANFDADNFLRGLDGVLKLGDIEHEHDFGCRISCVVVPGRNVIHMNLSSVIIQAITGSESYELKLISEDPTVESVNAININLEDAVSQLDLCSVRTAPDIEHTVPHHLKYVSFGIDDGNNSNVEQTISDKNCVVYQCSKSEEPKQSGKITKTVLLLGNNYSGKVGPEVSHAVSRISKRTTFEMSQTLHVHAMQTTSEIGDTFNSDLNDNIEHNVHIINSNSNMTSTGSNVISEIMLPEIDYPDESKSDEVHHNLVQDILKTSNSFHFNCHDITPEIELEMNHNSENVSTSEISIKDDFTLDEFVFDSDIDNSNYFKNAHAPCHIVNLNLNGITSEVTSWFKICYVHYIPEIQCRTKLCSGNVSPDICCKIAAEMKLNSDFLLTIIAEKTVNVTEIPFYYHSEDNVADNEYAGIFKSENYIPAIENKPYISLYKTGSITQNHIHSNGTAAVMENSMNFNSNGSAYGQHNEIHLNSEAISSVNNYPVQFHSEDTMFLMHSTVNFHSKSAVLISHTPHLNSTSTFQLEESALMTTNTSHCILDKIVVVNNSVSFDSAVIENTSPVSASNIPIYFHLKEVLHVIENLLHCYLKNTYEIECGVNHNFEGSRKEISNDNTQLLEGNRALLKIIYSVLKTTIDIYDSCRDIFLNVPMFLNCNSAVVLDTVSLHLGRTDFTSHSIVCLSGRVCKLNVGIYIHLIDYITSFWECTVPAHISNHHAVDFERFTEFPRSTISLAEMLYPFTAESCSICVNCFMYGMNCAQRFVATTNITPFFNATTDLNKAIISTVIIRKSPSTIPVYSLCHSDFVYHTCTISNYESFPLINVGYNNYKMLICSRGVHMENCDTLCWSAIDIRSLTEYLKSWLDLHFITATNSDSVFQLNSAIYLSVCECLVGCNRVASNSFPNLSRSLFWSCLYELSDFSHISLMKHDSPVTNHSVEYYNSRKSISDDSTVETGSDLSLLSSFDIDFALTNSEFISTSDHSSLEYYSFSSPVLDMDVADLELSFRDESIVLNFSSDSDTISNDDDGQSDISSRTSYSLLSNQDRESVFSEDACTFSSDANINTTQLTSYLRICFSSTDSETSSSLDCNLNGSDEDSHSTLDQVILQNHRSSTPKPDSFDEFERTFPCSSNSEFNSCSTSLSSLPATSTVKDTEYNSALTFSCVKCKTIAHNNLIIQSGETVLFQNELTDKVVCEPCHQHKQIDLDESYSCPEDFTKCGREIFHVSEQDLDKRRESLCSQGIDSDHYFDSSLSIEDNKISNINSSLKQGCNTVCCEHFEFSCKQNMITKSRQPHTFKRRYEMSDTADSTSEEDCSQEDPRALTFDFCNNNTYSNVTPSELSQFQSDGIDTFLIDGKHALALLSAKDVLTPTVDHDVSNSVPCIFVPSTIPALEERNNTDIHSSKVESYQREFNERIQSIYLSPVIPCLSLPVHNSVCSTPSLSEEHSVFTSSASSSNNTSEDMSFEYESFDTEDM